MSSGENNCFIKRYIFIQRVCLNDATNISSSYFQEIGANIEARIKHQDIDDSQLTNR